MREWYPGSLRTPSPAGGSPRSAPLCQPEKIVFFTNVFVNVFFTVELSFTHEWSLEKSKTKQCLINFFVGLFSLFRNIFMLKKG
jgi:hypothetical protein